MHIVVVHTFLWLVTGHCLRAGIIESHNFFVLCRILVKFQIRTRLTESFPTTYWSWWCAEEKLHVTPVHTLRQLKCNEGLFPPLPRSLADRNGLKNLPRQIFSACVKFGGNPCRDVETASPNLSEPVRTCPQYSDHVRCLRNAFFALSNALILQYYVLSC